MSRGGGSRDGWTEKRVMRRLRPQPLPSGPVDLSVRPPSPLGCSSKTALDSLLNFYFFCVAAQGRTERRRRPPGPPHPPTSSVCSPDQRCCDHHVFHFLCMYCIIAVFIIVINAVVLIIRRFSSDVRWVLKGPRCHTVCAHVTPAGRARLFKCGCM